MRKLLKQSLLLIVLTFVTVFIMQLPANAATAQPLIITEVKSNSATSGYCFFELYNNSAETINLKEYNIYYKYPSGTGLTWGTGGKDLMLESGKTMVFWLDNKGKPIGEFNSYYGVELVENETLFRISYAGLHGDLKRGFKIGKSTTSIVAECWFNDTLPDTVVSVYDGAIQYKFSTDSGIVETKLSTYATPTPGTVATCQVPQTAFSPVTDIKIPTINILEKDVFDVDDEIIIATTVTDANKMVLYYRQKSTEPYIRKEMQATATQNEYLVTVDKTTLWADSFSWFIEAENDTEFTITQEKSSQVQYGTELSKISPLIITEIVPSATSTASTPNPSYTYLELYNNSDKPINLAYYNFYYMYPTSLGQTWSVPLPEMFLQPGKTMVGWLDNKGKTVTDFNAYYGVNLTENVDIFKINYSGMHQTDKRGFKIGHTTTSTLVQATFNENGKDLFETNNKNSIKYTYPRTDNYTCEKVDTKTLATPGSVEAWQIPSNPVEFKGYDGVTDMGTTPILELAQPIPSSVQEGKELNVEFKCSDVVPIHTIIMNYRRNEETNFTQVIDKSQRIAGKYFARVLPNELLGYDSVEFYVEAYSPFRHVTSEHYTVKIDRLNDTQEGVRLSVIDNQILSKTITVSANDGGSNSNTVISVDGESKSTNSMMENGAYLSYTTAGINSYFKNAITVEDDVLYYMARWAGIFSKSTQVDNKYFIQNQDGSLSVTLTIWAGTTGSYNEIGTEVNNDDYTITGLKLYLPNGQYIEANNNDPNGKAITSSTVYKMGDSKGMFEKMDVKFTIPADKMTAVGFELNTTQLSDGQHVIKADSGTKTSTATIIVDNTKPEIAFGLEDGALVKNSFTIEPVVTDVNQIDGALSKLKLDETVITAPYTFVARDLTVGSHTIKASYTDIAGNMAEKSINFITEDFDPVVGSVYNDEQDTGSANLYVQITDSKGNNTTAEFLKGKILTTTNGGITVKAGEGDYALLNAKDSQARTVISESGDIPYQLFTVNTGELNNTDIVKVNCEAFTDYKVDAKIYVINTLSNQWDMIGSTTNGAIIIQFAAKNHIVDGKATLLVQGRSEKSYPLVSGTNINRNMPSSTNSSWDGTKVPDSYDFSLAWITDTQYYTETWPNHYSDMNKWIVDNRDKYNIQYTIHTGDLIDEWDMDYQWQVADKAMKQFDDAGMRYGVLAGNHDVAAGNEEYDNYLKYFGEDRFKNKDYYGGTYKNNLGHYDLLTVDGQDLIVLYMSWDIYTDEIQWMNEVLAKYADRKAIICLHRYINQAGVIDYAGEMIQEQVVAKNPNVFAVLNGHYHGAAIQVDGFDDNQDGISDRKVYQICTDYQSALEGGAEYIKMIYFDLNNDKVYMNSYSPVLNDFNCFDKAKLASYAPGTNVDELDIYECDVDFDNSTKSLTVESLSVDVYTENLIAKLESVNGEAKAQWSGLQTSASNTWYARITNENGGEQITVLNTINTTTAAITITAIEPVNVPTIVGTAPVMPEQVTATYSDNTTSRVPVQWNTINPTEYATVRDFTVEGSVENTTIPAIAVINVKDASVSIIEIQPVHVVTTVGTKPVMPDQVTVTYSDNTTSSSIYVTWDAIDPEQYAVVGSFTVEGSVNNTTIAAIALVTVNPVPSSSNNDSPPTPTPTQIPNPVIVDKEIVKIVGKADANGIVAISVKADDLKAAVNNTKDGVVGIEVKVPEGAKEVKVNLPIQQITSSGKKIDSIKINTGFAIVTINPELLKNINMTDSSNLQLSVCKVDTTKLPEEVRQQIGNSEVYDFSLNIDGNKISAFKSSEISVEVDYTLKPGEDPNKVIIYYVNDSGKLEVVKNSKYNTVTGKVQFKPEHFSKYLAAYAVVTFEDLGKAKWAKSSIEALAARGIISGVGDNTFKPNSKVTRAEFLTILMNAFELIDESAKCTFNDVGEEKWYYSPIATAQKFGIIQGKNDGSFGVNDKISRQDMAVILYRVAQLLKADMNVSQTTTKFTDYSEISTYATEAISAMHSSKIISGTGDGIFAPKSGATRAEASVVIYKVFNLVK